MSISIVTSTHNRAKSLARMLASVKLFADEIIVVDSASTDETSAVAKKFTRKLYRRENNLMLNVNKNFGFLKATGDWILNLDDDEEIPPDLARVIRSLVDTAPSDVAGYWLPRKNIIFGKWIRTGLWWPDRQLRLFRRGAGRFPEKHVHEYLEVAGKTETVSEPFVHYNYDSVAQYLTKMESIYIESELKKYEASGYRVDWKDAIRFPLSDFVKIYFAESGYKDGLHGLVLSMLQAFYSFLIFVKLWERDHFSDIDLPLSGVTNEMRRAGGEVQYWIQTAHMKESVHPLRRLWYRIRRHYGK